MQRKEHRESAGQTIEKIENACTHHKCEKEKLPLGSEDRQGPIEGSEYGVAKHRHVP